MVPQAAGETVTFTCCVVVVLQVVGGVGVAGEFRVVGVVAAVVVVDG